MNNKNFKFPPSNSTSADQLVLREEKIMKLQKKHSQLRSSGAVASFSNDSDKKNMEEKKELSCQESMLTNTCFGREESDILIESSENNNSLISESKFLENLENTLCTSFVSRTLMEEIPSIFNEENFEYDLNKNTCHKNKSFKSIEKELNLIIEENESPLLENESSLENMNRIGSIYKKLDSYDKRRLFSENPDLRNFVFQLSEKEAVEEEPLKLSLLHMEVQEGKAAQKITFCYVK